MKHQQKKLVKQKEEKACATTKRHYCNNINWSGATKKNVTNPSPTAASQI
jgi:hypothetical protein